MTGWRRAAAVVAAALAAGTAVGPAAAAGVGHRVLFSFDDPAITESSGLVDRGAVVYTMNDSGAGPVLYAVDPATGDTTGTTTYSSGSVEDVEALAPGRGGTVWVGDIGDNLTRRDFVSVYRVRPGGGDVPAIDLAYPDGPHDAETLLVQPRTERLFVVSKSVFGGVVYEARSLHPGALNRLRRFAQVPGLVTDGTFFPDGRHVLLRTYGTASVYTFPGFSLVGSVDLPPQEQGEGISVGPGGRILLSSEGDHSEVLQITLPAKLVAAMKPPAPSTRTSAPTGPVVVADRPGRGGWSDLRWGWAAASAMVLGLGAVGVLVWRHRRD